MPSLEVQLGTKLDAFEKGMDDAVSIADRAVSDIESKFDGLNPGFSGLSSALAGALTSIPAILAFAKSMNSELAQMERTAREVGQTLEEFQGGQFAASTKGIGSSDYVSSLEKSVALLNDAQRNTNTLSELFAANSLSLKQQNGQLISTNELLRRSADLIAKAASEQDKIKIAQMLGLTKEWIPLLEGGAAAFERQAGEAARLGVVIDRDTIEKAAEFDRKWTESSARWSANIKAAAAEILPSINELIDAAGKMFTRENLLKFSNDGQDLLGQAGVPKELNIKIPDFAVDFFKELGKELNVNIVIHGKTPEQLVNEAIDEAGATPITGPTRLRVTGTPTAIPPRRTPTGGEGRDPFETTVDQTNRRIAVLNAETATIGQNSEARERARTVAVLEEAAKRANTAAGRENTEVTADQRKQIDLLADAMEEAAKRNRLMSEAMSNFRELGSAAAEAFKGLTLEGKKFDEVLGQLLNRLASRAIDNAFSSLFNSVGSSLFGSLFGAGNATSTMGFNPIAGAFSFGGGRASGGDVSPGNVYRVGENGPEWFVPRGNGQIIPNDIAPGMGGGPIHVGGTSIVVQGSADERTLAIMRQELAARDAQMPARVVQAVRNAQTTRNLR